MVDLYGSPLYGIKTGFNSAFVIDRATRDQLIAEDVANEKVIRPFLEGKDLKAWHVVPRDLWIVYMVHGVNISEYPSIAKYLAQYRDQLEKRATSQSWYELQQPQAKYAPYYERPKIVYPRFVNQPVFALDSSGFYVNNAISAIPTSDPPLLFTLMSPVAWFFLLTAGAPMANGYRQIHGHVLESVPIPQFTPDTKASIQLWLQQSEARGSYADPPWYLLYQAFDLTAEEIALLTGSFSK